MKKHSQFDAAYDALTRIESGPINDEAARELATALTSRTSLLVARSAQIAGKRSVGALIPDLVAAFDRLTSNGPKADKQCNAKEAIADALNKLEYTGNAVFPTGAYYVQMEPAYGGPEDTAVNLRCSCAYGLARTGHPDAVLTLADLLVDSEHAVRAAAAKALSYLASPESEALLRLKVLTGDAEAEVTGECFTGLITMSPDRSLDFVARYLQSDDATLVECAALAIGGSHAPGAFETLRKCWEDDPSPTRRRGLLLPIALIRTDDAFSFLIEIVRSADSSTAAEALSALNLYADESSVARIREAADARSESDVLRRFDREFPSH